MVNMFIEVDLQILLTLYILGTGGIFIVDVIRTLQTFSTHLMANICIEEDLQIHLI